MPALGLTLGWALYLNITWFLCGDSYTLWLWSTRYTGILYIYNTLFVLQPGPWLWL